MRHNCLLAGFTLTVLFSGGTAFGADPRLLNLVMPDAGTVAGVNVTSAEITPFGQYVLTQMTSQANQQFQAFIAATGFDPRQDVSEILAASSGNLATPSGLVLALGNFPVAQITVAIAAKAPQLTVTTYGGATLITGSDAKAKSSYSIAFLGTSIAVVGDTASVKAAIDRSAGANSLNNTALAVQIQALSTSEDAWAVTTSPAGALIPGLVSAPGAGASPLSGFSQMLSGIQGSSGGIKFGTTVVITGQAIASDAATAKSLADVLQALASIASMAGGQGTEMASIAQLIQGLTVTASGTEINLTLSIPETQLEAVLNGIKSQSKSAAKPVALLQNRN